MCYLFTEQLNIPNFIMAEDTAFVVRDAMTVLSLCTSITTYNRTCVSSHYWNTFQLGWPVFSCPFTHISGVLQNPAMSCHVKWSRCLAYSIVTYDGELCGKFVLGFIPSPFWILVPAASLLGGFLDIFVQKLTCGFLGNSGFGFKLHCQDSAKFLWNCQPGHIVFVCIITSYNMHSTGCLVTCDLQQKQKLHPQMEPNISSIIRRYDNKL